MVVEHLPSSEASQAMKARSGARRLGDTLQLPTWTCGVEFIATLPSGVTPSRWTEYPAQLILP